MNFEGKRHRTANSPIKGSKPPSVKDNTFSGAQKSLLDLQNRIGNQAVLKLLQVKTHLGIPARQNTFENQIEINNTADTVTKAIRSPGKSMDQNTRKSMENAFKRDFSSVRIHTDNKAAESARLVNAAAYTIGKDIVFADGEYNPGTFEGNKLIAHELTHVVQQGNSNSRTALIHNKQNAALEKQADDISSRVSKGESVDIHTSNAAPGLIQRKNAKGAGNQQCESIPSNPGIGVAVGEWLGLMYRRDHGIDTYLLVDWWIFGPNGRLGTLFKLGPKRDGIDPDVFLALMCKPEWFGTTRVDILDSDRDHIYEIKPRRGAAAGAPQLNDYLINLTTHAQMRPSWMGGGPRNWQPGPWTPPPVLDLPAINAKIEFWRDPYHPGVIIYDVLNCKKEEDDENSNADAIALRKPNVDIIELEPELDQLAPMLRDAILVKQLPAGRDYIIISPPGFYTKYVADPGINEKMKNYEINPHDARKNPVTGFRNLGWTLVGISAGLYVLMYIAVLGAGEVTVAGSAASSAAIPAEGATILPFVKPGVDVAAKIAANEAVKSLSKAAAVLLIVGSSQNADAISGESGPTLESFDAIMAVPKDELKAQQQDNFSMGTVVYYSGKKYVVIGRTSG
ncbi:MAG: DUF4157 domain-containing protein [Clostridia bacterium]|nr:DUF4157 domain-containing protein [Clostridia bacterium]